MYYLRSFGFLISMFWRDVKCIFNSNGSEPSTSIFLITHSNWHLLHILFYFTFEFLESLDHFCFIIIMYFTNGCMKSLNHFNSISRLFQSRFFTPNLYRSLPLKKTWYKFPRICSPVVRVTTLLVGSRLKTNTKTEYSLQQLWT